MDECATASRTSRAGRPASDLLVPQRTPGSRTLRADPRPADRLSPSAARGTVSATDEVDASSRYRIPLRSAVGALRRELRGSAYLPRAIGADRLSGPSSGRVRALPVAGATVATRALGDHRCVSPRLVSTARGVLHALTRTADCSRRSRGTGPCVTARAPAPGWRPRFYRSTRALPDLAACRFWPAMPPRPGSRTKPHTLSSARLGGALASLVPRCRRSYTSRSLLDDADYSGGSFARRAAARCGIASAVTRIRSPISEGAWRLRGKAATRRRKRKSSSTLHALDWVSEFRAIEGNGRELPAAARSSIQGVAPATNPAPPCADSRGSGARLPRARGSRSPGRHGRRRATRR